MTNSDLLKIHQRSDELKLYLENFIKEWGKGQIKINQKLRAHYEFTLKTYRLNCEIALKMDAYRQTRQDGALLSQ